MSATARLASAGERMGALSVTARAPGCKEEAGGGVPGRRLRATEEGARPAVAPRGACSSRSSLGSGRRAESRAPASFVLPSVFMGSVEENTSWGAPGVEMDAMKHSSEEMLSREAKD